MLRSRFLIDVVAPVLCVCWAAVLIYGAFAGKAGYNTLGDLQRELRHKTLEFEALNGRREALERRADLLNSKSLDPDLIDERIRAVLGFSADGDIIIPRRELDRIVDSRPIQKR